MESALSSALQLLHQPVVLSWSDTAPDGAIQFGKGKFGCVMNLFAAAAKGKAAVCDRETFGCFGGGTGMGLGDQYQNFPGGADCFCHFLSSGNQGFPRGEGVASHMQGKAPDHFLSEFMKGERYVKTPELVGKKFLQELPLADVPVRYAVFRPLSGVAAEDDQERGLPRIVTFVVDPDQLSALVILANYGRETLDNVTIPFVAGCQALGLMPMKEAASQTPRAVVGLVDLSARVNTRTSLGAGLFTFSVPWAMFEEMEGNVPGSFLERDTWRELRGHTGSN